MRSARPGLRMKYHYLIISQFFGVPNVAAPARPSLVGFMASEGRRETRKLLHYLDLALDPKVGQEAAVAKLLEKLGYDDGDRTIFIRHVLLLVICEVFPWHRPTFAS